MKWKERSLILDHGTLAFILRRYLSCYFDIFRAPLGIWAYLCLRVIACFVITNILDLDHVIFNSLYIYLG